MAKTITKSGPKPWQPTDEDRRLIEHYISIGYTQTQVAELMGKSVDSLARHCPRELSLGALTVNAKIGGKLFQKAMGGDTAALIFWAKTRMGWKETNVNEHAGAVTVKSEQVSDAVDWIKRAIDSEERTTH